jgi:PKHD-type hydroxylase
MTTVSSWAFRADPTENWAFMDGVFTPDECRRIIALGAARLPKPAKVAPHGVSDTAVRDSRIVFLHPADDMEWAFRRMTDAVMLLNERYFGFDLFGMTEGFQFTRYDAPTGFYGMHIDKATGGPVRKLSLTIQLSAPADYDGGELALQIGAAPVAMPRQQGQLIVFPSYVLHEVRPVTRGTRYSLVSWVTGAPFS